MVNCTRKIGNISQIFMKQLEDEKQEKFQNTIEFELSYVSIKNVKYKV